MTSFYIKCNTGLIWANSRVSRKAAIFKVSQKSRKHSQGSLQLLSKKFCLTSVSMPRILHIYYSMYIYVYYHKIFTTQRRIKLFLQITNANFNSDATTQGKVFQRKISKKNYSCTEFCKFFQSIYFVERLWKTASNTSN